MPDLGQTIGDFLADAGASGDFTREQLRAIRGALAHVVTSDLADTNIAAVRSKDIRALASRLHAAGLPDPRIETILDALRLVFLHATARRLVHTSPLA